jgi:hypothetical protein
MIAQLPARLAKLAMVTSDKATLKGKIASGAKTTAAKAGYVNGSRNPGRSSGIGS